jgi:hypothetical protein
MSMSSMPTRRRRLMVALLLAIAVAVPVLTLPALPQLSWWPALLGLAPWIIGQVRPVPAALARAVRERPDPALAHPGLRRGRAVRAAHAGARRRRRVARRRLTRTGMSTPDAVAEAGLDRLVGAIGLAAFVGFSAVALPARMLLTAGGVAVVAVALAVVVGRRKPHLVPKRRLPAPRKVAYGVLLSAAYQLSICLLLLGTGRRHRGTRWVRSRSWGLRRQPAGRLGAGPHGASPRDGALVVALAGLGLPWQAALGAVALKATLAWLPALALGGVSLLLARRYAAHRHDAPLAI